MNLDEYVKRSTMTINSILDHSLEIENAVEIIVSALKSKKKVMFCGNGGSAADAQHLSAELMGRFLIDREPLPSLSLTVDTSALTAIANDYGYKHVFSRQIQGIGRSGDVLIGLSTSGNSKNIVEAFKKANELKIHTIAMVGKHSNLLSPYADSVIRCNSEDTNFIQEAHIVIGHYLCLKVEEALC